MPNDLWTRATGRCWRPTCAECGRKRGPAYQELSARAQVLRSGLLASASEDRTAELWDTDVARAEERACALSGPVITREQWSGYLPDVPYRDRVNASVE